MSDQQPPVGSGEPVPTPPPVPSEPVWQGGAPAEGPPPPPVPLAPSDVPAQAPSTWPTVDSQPAPPIPPYQPSPAVAPSPVYPPNPQTSSNAIIALILAVVSWAVCPLIPAIVALVFAANGAKEIAASRGTLGGQGLVTAAKIVAWINIGFYAALIVVGGFLFVLFAIAGAAG